MPLMRWFSILLFSLLVTACGGGGTIDKTNNNTGDGGSSSDYQLTLSILEQTTELSLQTPLTIEATLNNDGAAVANTRINFTTDEYARFDGPASVLTNSEGKATVKLLPTDQKGAGAVSASVSIAETTLEEQIDFTSLGDGGLKITVTIKDTDGAVITQDNPLSTSKPAIVTVEVMNDNTPVSQAVVELDTDQRAELDYDSGLTESDGKAVFFLTPNTTSGPGFVTVTYKGTLNEQTDDVIARGYFFTEGFSTSSISLSIDMSDADGNAITTSNRLSEDKNASVVVTLLEGSKPLSEKFITISAGNKGITVPADGRVVTDLNGQATITLLANTESGVDALTATYTHNDTDVVAVRPYYTASNPKFDADPYKISFTAKNPLTNEPSNMLAGGSALTLEAQVLLNNEPVTNTRLQFEVDQYARLDHSSGSILTNQEGIASVNLLDNDLEGAGKATVSFEKPDGSTISSNIFFDSAGTGGIRLAVSDVLDKDGNKISLENKVSAETDGFVTVTLTENSVGVSNALILVQGDSIGSTDPSNGKIVTNDTGVASFKLKPTTEAGLGEFTVTYQQTENLVFRQTGYYQSSGNPNIPDTSLNNIDVRILTGCNDDWDANRNEVRLDPTEPNSGCTNSAQLSSNELAEIYILVTPADNDTAYNRQIVSVETTLGQVLPTNGTALTDDQGVALLKFQPGDTGGAGSVTVTFRGESSAANFSVGVVDIEMTLDDGLLEGVSELKAGGSTIITATLRDKETGDLILTPTDVTFSSVCAASNETELDSLVKSSNGIATATYRANGCVGTDTITATIEAGGNNAVQTLALTVSKAEAQALKFLTDNDGFEQFIALPPGEGGAPTLSVVEFQLLDVDTKPIKQKRIDFRLTDSTGAASLTQTTSSTNNEGRAQTTVTSGTVPGPLVVQACYIPDELITQGINESKPVTCWADEVKRCVDTPTAEGCPENGYIPVEIGDQITGISSRILLSSGVTDQDSFDAALVTRNINGLDYLGATVDINIYFGDQFNQLSGDGVTATVVTNSGVVGTLDGEDLTPLYNCSSVDATCTLTWRRQGDIPFSESSWGNQIGDVCDTYFGEPAPCIGSYPTVGSTDSDGNVTSHIVQGGRVNFLVVAKGQETFIDRPSDVNNDGDVTLERRNGRFDEGEFYQSYDRPEPFIDLNANGTYDGDVICSDESGDDVCTPKNSDGGVFETFRDSNNDGLYTQGNGIYDGLLCGETAQASGKCNKGLIEVRRNLELVLSDDDPFVRFAVNKDDVDLTIDNNLDGQPDELQENTACANVTLPALDADGNVIRDSEGEVVYAIIQELEPITGHDDLCDIKQVTLGDRGVEGLNVYIYFSDRNGNPLPAGTEVEISSTNGKLDVSGLNSVIPNTGRTESDYAIATLSREVESNGQETGQLTIQFTFTKPDGENKVVSHSITVNDANP
ncbi:hypothetical protein C1E24_15475 [Pseudoalteromonas phenolica]|uniref:Invasin n=1 Tax=Pseudoalteromonas phenolica TaxID=161398 RepID=A0A5R9PZ81_9GAMM|nr:hypothetical protein [Pseudoalteromonas phenolica]TLX46161.1 hypothetical protein C1E24_15475 [Pseudoalteromonas phenolica]